MKKKAILNSTFAVLLLLLSGCGDKGTGALDDPSAESVEVETTITAIEKSTLA